MINSPFKFLDSYTKEDSKIFFGREQETDPSTPLRARGTNKIQSSHF